MGRIEDTFERLKAHGRKAFMPFVTACDPTCDATVEIVHALEAAGADIIELGFAYSDPLADGPVIQDSYARVLGGGCSVNDAFGVVREIRRRSRVPIAAMVSYSIVWRKGAAEFAKAAVEAGVDALIIPDLPPEESEDISAAADANSIGLVFLVTPTTNRKRARAIVAASRPFVYYVSVVGITGARVTLPPELADGVRAVKAMTERPVVVGFGVSAPEQAAAVARVADGVIVGSGIVKVIADNAGKPAAAIAKAVADYAAPIADAIRR